MALGSFIKLISGLPSLPGKLVEFFVESEHEIINNSDNNIDIFFGAEINLKLSLLYNFESTYKYKIIAAKTTIGINIAL